MTDAKKQAWDYFAKGNRYLSSEDYYKENPEKSDVYRAYLAGHESTMERIRALEEALKFYADKQHIVEVNTEQEYSLRVEDGMKARTVLGVPS